MERDANAATPMEIALFNLMGALCFRLTGDVPTIRVRQSEGMEFSFYPDLTRVEWPSVDQSAAGLAHAKS